MTDNRDHTTDAQTYPAKVWISTDYVPKHSRWHLTPYRWYEVTYDDDERPTIIDDEGDVISITLSLCRHLNWLDWTIHTSPDAPASAPEMQVWHEPGPQPSPVPDEWLLWFVVSTAAGFVMVTALAWIALAWMVTR